MPRVELQIPPRSVYVGVVRLTVASLARGAGMDEEVVEDLRIAVSEACTNAVLAAEEAGSDAPVAMVWDPGSDHVSVAISDGNVPPGAGEGAGLTDSQGFSTREVMGRALLESLAATVSVEPHEGGTVTRLSFPFHPEE